MQGTEPDSFNSFENFLTKHGIDMGFLLSGFFGALLLSIKQKKQKISKSIACIFAGAMCANYLTPLILNVSPASIQDKGKYAVAFMMGYSGLKGLEIIVDFVTSYIKETAARKHKQDS